jgi:anti-anti-sigma factor
MQKKTVQDGGGYFEQYHVRHPDASASLVLPAAVGLPAGIIVSGVLDSETAPDFFDAAVATLSGLPSGSELELRLEGVRFISSTGVGALTRLLAAAQTQGVALRISGVSPACEDVFSVLGLLRYFNIPGVES